MVRMSQNSGIILSWVCAGLVHGVTTAVTPYVELPGRAQQTLLLYSYP